jgi:hypothetical protein
MDQTEGKGKRARATPKMSYERRFDVALSIYL